MALIGLDLEYQLATIALKQKQPVLLYGPTGNGKTILARKVAEDYAKDTDIPVVYQQLYPEMTKNTLIGGETIKDGSIVIMRQAIANFGEKGACFIIDEATHSLEHVLLAFNSLLEQPFSTIIGTEVVTMNPKTRFIFCGNTPDHAGNIHLPISLANRLFIIKMELPTNETLAAIGKEHCTVEGADDLIKFVAEIISKVHEQSLPVSPRNMVNFVTVLPGIIGTGFNKGAAKAPLPNILGICHKLDINTDILQKVIMSMLMGNVVTKSTAPEKVRGALW